MPEKSGMKAPRELRQDPATESLPVVIINGVSDEIRACMEHRKQLKPPVAYAFQPIDRQEFLETVNRLLA